MEHVLSSFLQLLSGLGSLFSVAGRPCLPSHAVTALITHRVLCVTSLRTLVSLLYAQACMQMYHPSYSTCVYMHEYLQLAKLHCYVYGSTYKRIYVCIHSTKTHVIHAFRYTIPFILQAPARTEHGDEKTAIACLNCQKFAYNVAKTLIFL